MPRYREYCPGRVVEQLTPTLHLEARCMLHDGHREDCAADVTRWRLRWSAPEARAEAFETGEEGAEGDGVAEGEQAGEPREAVAAHGGEGHRS